MKSVAKAPLTSNESKRYRICKGVISDGLQTFWDVGLALKEIRDTKLYRIDFDTFEAFCRKSFNMSGSHAYRMIAASVVKVSPIGEVSERKTLGDNGASSASSEKIKTESQARALAKVPEAEREKVLEIAASAGPVTARSIAVAAEKTLSEKKDEPALDDTGYRIPSDCVQFWNRKGEIQELMTLVSRVKSKLEHARAEDDVLFRNVSQAVSNQLELAYSFLANAKPYAVCLHCQGNTKDNCRSCKGTGLMARFPYEHAQVKELRGMREAMIKKASK